MAANNGPGTVGIIAHIA